MKIVKKEIVNHEVKYIVEANQESWKKSQDNSYKILSKQLKIPGFRAGRVPLDVAKKQISSSEVMNHALKKVIDENYRLLLDSKDFIRDELIEEGVSVDIAKIDEATLQIVYIFEKVPEVTIDQDYRKIKIECVEPAIQQSDIENEINRYTKKDTMLIPKENGIIAHGDMVNFDFKGFLDDKPFPGGEAKGYELEIGSNTFIPGFEEQMINLKKDDKKTIDITFPKDYQAKDLAGKKTKFELVINDVKTIQRPKMDETYIAKFGIPNIKTVAEFKKYVGDQLLDHKKYIAKQEAVKEISK
jgi:trigger factor